MAQKARRSEVSSIAQLAQHLGLAQGTVSRALNGYPDIAQRTRQRVREAARELNYRPSSVARQLARGIVETIGFVLPGRTGHLSDPFLGEILDGVAIQLAEHDWDLVITAVPEGHDETDVIGRLIRSGKVSGLILSRTRRNDARVDLLLETGLPFIVHGRTDDSGAYSWLDFDNAGAFREAVSYLAGLGHKRIAHLGGDQDLNFAFQRLAGYRQAMQELDLEILDGYVATDCIDTVTGKEAMAAMLALPAPPTAVVCVTDTIALGAMRAIDRAGLEPGRDVSVTGYDGLPAGLAADPPLTTMSQSSHKAGRELARMLMTRITGQGDPISQQLWEATLTHRASANPPVA